MVGRFILYYFV